MLHGMSTLMRMTDLRRFVLGPCVLALLDIRPRYGLELVRDLTQAGELMTSGGTVYPLLNRLAELGLVESSWEIRSRAVPRLWYSITDSGRLELKKNREEWVRFQSLVDAVLMVNEKHEER
jgi:PadR family transcriptional regulator PadR